MFKSRLRGYFLPFEKKFLAPPPPLGKISEKLGGVVRPTLQMRNQKLQGTVHDKR